MARLPGPMSTACASRMRRDPGVPRRRRRTCTVPMLEDRHYNRTFFSAPQSVTSLVAALLEPLISALMFRRTRQLEEVN